MGNLDHDGMLEAICAAYKSNEAEICKSYGISN